MSPEQKQLQLLESIDKKLDKLTSRKQKIIDGVVDLFIKILLIILALGGIYLVMTTAINNFQTEVSSNIQNSIKNIKLF